MYVRRTGSMGHGHGTAIFTLCRIMSYYYELRLARGWSCEWAILGRTTAKTTRRRLPLNNTVILLRSLGMQNLAQRSCNARRLLLDLCTI